jgi:hypothetical protein
MSEKKPQTNRDRLLRAVRTLQHLQRTNAPKSTISKAAGKALIPLLEEMENHPLDAPQPITPAA